MLKKIGVIAHQNILEAFRVLMHKKYVNPLPSSKALECLAVFESLCTLVSPDLTTLLTAKEFKVINPL